MYKFLLDLALILLSTKLLGMLTRKFQMPQVVGALLAGLLLGPAVFNILNETQFIHDLSEVGVIVLMFCAGLESDIKELKKTGKASFVIALIGVLVPLLGGFLVAFVFNRPDMIPSDASGTLFLQNIFIGVILTATSVSITVETLKEMGKLNAKAGNAILGAAIIDDILGIIALTVVTSLADTSGDVNLVKVLLLILGFFAFSGIVGFIFYKLFKHWTEAAPKDLRRFVIAAFVFCLLLSYIAEEYFGVADITGAFICGLIISNTQRSKYIASRFETLSYIMLSPIFFASIGINVQLPKMSGNIIAFAIILILVAILTKVVGCGIGAKLFHYSNKEAVQIGVGMVSRGEVALIVANKGKSVGLMPSNLMGPIVIMVVVTTIIAPILLKLAFRSHDGATEQSGLTDAYEDMNKYRQDIPHEHTK